MENRVLFDNHIHSDNSHDGKHSVTLICQQAIENGLSGLAITDHCECIDYWATDNAMNCRQSAFETRKAAAVFGSAIEVISGIEFGSPTRDLAAVEDALKNNYDCVLASVHRLKGKKKGMGQLDYTRETNTPELLVKRYLDEIIETVDWNGFDILAHLTYPIRYFFPEQLLNFDPMMFEEEWRYVLKTLADNGKALEINTAYDTYITKTITGNTHPSLEFLKIFKEYGGEYLTAGSDSHDAFTVGRKIYDAYDLAKAAGFEYITHYKRRKPITLRIDEGK